MSVYWVKGKGWRYDFTRKGMRYTEAWYKTKKEAKQAEARKLEELKNPKPKQETEEIETGTDFLALVNRRLDHVKAYNSKKHYQDYFYMARRWVKLWGQLECEQISQHMIEKFVLKRSKVSPFTANKEIRYLRSTFNFGLKKKMISQNPVDGIDFLPVEKRVKYIPPQEDIEKVITLANPDDRDYLIVIQETMGRMSEINRLTWDDVDFDKQDVILYTRKKRGGHLTPRKIPMTGKLYDVLKSRYSERDKSKPWVFWHTYWSSKTGEKVQGPYKERKKFMRTLCKKAGVKYFRFHAVRHSSASIMDNAKVPIGAIQKILGHENRSTTEIYLHTIGDAERHAISVFERAREKSHTDSHTEEKKGFSRID